jgi:hypothetical protein
MKTIQEYVQVRQTVVSWVRESIKRGIRVKEAVEAYQVNSEMEREEVVNELNKMEG